MVCFFFYQKWWTKNSRFGLIPALYIFWNKLGILKISSVLNATKWNLLFSYPFHSRQLFEPCGAHTMEKLSIQIWSSAILILEASCSYVWNLKFIYLFLSSCWLDETLVRFFFFFKWKVGRPRPTYQSVLV